MIETVGQVIGIVFVSIIVICVISTILNYIFDSKLGPKNELEDNLKKYSDKKYK
jgi:hypothetical protein